MIISHKHKFCFVHIPKNGGTFIKSVLSKYHDDPITFYGVCKIKDTVKDLSHINMQDLKHLFDRIQEQSYVTFCIIRDPIERFKSGYIEYVHHIQAYFKEKPLDIPQLLEVLESDVFYGDSRYVHLLPQTYYTHEGHKQTIDHILNLNNLDTNLNKLLTKLNIDNVDVINSFKSNQGKSNKFDQIYNMNESQIRSLKNIYVKDYDLLDNIK
jgi:uncharacterized protein YfkK (UPF0435 family)